MKAIDLFGELENGILHSIKAAEIYALHVGSIYGGRELNQSLIRGIITDKVMSGIRVLSISYGQVEKEEIVQKGYLVNIGNQILLATYTALEVYLINKFKEYTHHKAKGNKELNERLLDNLSFRSLAEIRRLYKEILEIYLLQFEIDNSVSFDEHSSFKPKNTWDGITTIEKARHEIAHEGRAKTYEIHILPDVWDAFEFVRRWVMLFDANFDALIYEGRSSRLIREYKKRVTQIKGNRREKAEARKGRQVGSF